MARIGEMSCLNIDECSCKEVAVHKTASGNLTATCHKCGCPTFAKSGTKWRRTMEKRVRLDPPDDDAPPAAQKPTPPAAPVPPAKKAGFSMGL